MIWEILKDSATLVLGVWALMGICELAYNWAQRWRYKPAVVTSFVDRKWLGLGVMDWFWCFYLAACVAGFFWAKSRDLAGQLAAELSND